MNSIVDPYLAPAPLSLFPNRVKHVREFDVAMEHLVNQMSHQAVNQHLNNAAFGQGTISIFKTKDDKGQDLEMWICL